MGGEINTLRETIREISRNHLEQNNGLLLGQCLTAVGFVNGTIPENCPNIIELPMCDVAGAGIAVGAAIAERRPILVIRYQDFITLGMSPIVNYAAKTKDMFGKGTPIFIRLLADEGKGLGPVHSGKLHSIFMHFPGMRVCAPMTPEEYEECWRVFMEKDEPMIVSEHRCSFSNSEEMQDVVLSNTDITIYGVSKARFNMLEAANVLWKDGITCNLVHIMWLKPFTLDERLLGPLRGSRAGIVVDSGFEMAGASQSIAYQLMLATGKPVRALALMDKSVGVTPESENATPDANKIAEMARREYYCARPTISKPRK